MVDKKVIVMFGVPFSNYGCFCCHGGSTTEARSQFSSVQFSSVLFHICSGHAYRNIITKIGSIDLHINTECYSEWRKDQ